MWQKGSLHEKQSDTPEQETCPRHPAEPSLIEWNRVFTIPDFLRNLFGDIPVVQDDINDLFKDTSTHFNHVIKSYEHSTSQRQYLTGLLMRGAALLCANCQESIDVAIPFLYGTGVIAQENTSFILAQIKLSQKFTSKPNWKINEQMCPYRLGIVKPPLSSIHPVVRIVFALASKTNVVEARKIRIWLDSGIYYDANDIWCAGVGSDVLPCIAGSRPEHEMADSWSSLLSISQKWKVNYAPLHGVRKTGGIKPEEYLQSMTPCLAEDAAFWNWQERSDSD